MHHERPGKGLPESLICKRRKLHLPPPGAATAISEVLPEREAKVRLWTGASAWGRRHGLGGNSEGSKQTLAGCLGGGAFMSSPPKSPAKGCFHAPCPNGKMEAQGREMTCFNHTALRPRISARSLGLENQGPFRFSPTISRLNRWT